jgi:hypothetical protein
MLKNIFVFFVCLFVSVSFAEPNNVSDVPDDAKTIEEILAEHNSNHQTNCAS